MARCLLNRRFASASETADPSYSPFSRPVASALRLLAFDALQPLYSSGLYDLAEFRQPLLMAGVFPSVKDCGGHYILTVLLRPS
jgi:hypothetical protein